MHGNAISTSDANGQLSVHNRKTSWLWVSTIRTFWRCCVSCWSGHHSKTLGAEETKAPSKVRFDESNELNLRIIKDNSRIVELSQLNWKTNEDINSLRPTLATGGNCWSHVARPVKPVGTSLIVAKEAGFHKVCPDVPRKDTRHTWHTHTDRRNPKSVRSTKSKDGFLRKHVWKLKCFMLAGCIWLYNTDRVQRASGRSGWTSCGQEPGEWPKLVCLCLFMFG